MATGGWQFFLEDGDYALYRDLLAERCRANGVQCWAYCLMPNPVRLILRPTIAESLSRAGGETHRRYSSFINARARVTGHFFQGRFFSAAMDESHFLAAVRYLAFNPVRAKLVERPQNWPWSSAAAHLGQRNDPLVRVQPLLAVAPSPDELFTMSLDEASALFALETKSVTGRPLGDAGFIADVERRLGYAVTPRKRGPKPKLA